MRPALPVLLALAVAMAGCATTAAVDDPTAALREPDVTRTVAENGDVIEEFRVNGQLQVVRVTPSRGPVYYLTASGREREDGQPMSPVNWKLFDWD